MMKNSYEEIKKTFSNLFWLILKVLISSYFTTFFDSAFFTSTVLSETSMHFVQLEMKAKCIIIFIFIFIAVNIFSFGVRQIILWFLGDRLFDFKKKKASDSFHNEIKKNIESGAQYVQNIISQKDKDKKELNNSDSANKKDYCSYETLLIDFSNAIYLFSKAIKDLEDLLPKCKANNTFKEKYNIKYINYIGVDHILIYINYGIENLKKAEVFLEDNKNDLLDEKTIFLMGDLYNDFNLRFVKPYENLYERVCSYKSSQ